MKPLLSLFSARRALSGMLIVVVACTSLFAFASRTGRNYQYKDDVVTSLSMSMFLEDTNMACIRGALMEAAPGVESKFAATFGWVMVSMTASGSGVYSNGQAAAVIRGFDAWAALDNGKRPEFRNMPFITFGSSAGGVAAYGLAMYAPNRCLAFGANVPAGYNPTTLTDAMLRVPGIFTVGEVDPLVNNGPGNAFVAFASARGALWSYMNIWGMDHAKNRVMHVFSSFFEKAIKYSYPDSMNPKAGPITLRRPPESSGWLGDTTTWRSGFTTIASYANYTGNKSVAHWLWDEDIAWLYRGYTSTNTKVALRTKDTTVTNDFLSWWVLNLYQSGNRIDLMVDTTKMPGWTKIELYRGCTLIDSIKRGQALGDTIWFKVTAPATPMMQAYNLMGYGPGSQKSPSILYTVMVQQPKYATAVRQPQGMVMVPLARPQQASAVYSLTGRRMTLQPLPGSRAGVLMLDGQGQSVPQMIMRGK